MSELYKIIIEQEGVNHVKVFKAEGDAFVNDWNFPLKGDDEPIVLSVFYTESRFVLMNWNGWIRAYDSDTKELVFDHKLNGSVDAKAVLSLDKSKLYVALTLDSSAYLIQISLDTFAIETLELPDIYNDLLQIRKDGSLLFYKEDSKFLEDKKVYTHFYSVLDVHTKNIEQFEFPYAAQYPFNEFKPVIDIDNNWAIMPAYEDITHKTNSAGETVFEFKIVLFDLNSFEIVALLSVRDFTKDQLGYSEHDCYEMNELFLATERKKAYYNSLREFYENLTSIKVVADGFWICFRGGILRKIDLNFNLSPLLATSSRANNSTEGIFQHGHFHSHLYQIDEQKIILAEHLNLYKASMPEINSADIETPIALTFEETRLEEIFNLRSSTENKNEVELRDYIQIEVKDLTKKKGFTDALKQIETVVSDLNAAGIGSILKFIINDTKNKTFEEPEFFAKAIEHDSKRIVSIVKKFIGQPKSQYIYRNPEETALCYAAFELAKLGDQYETTVFQYLAAIDLDHDVFNKEYILPLLEENYNHDELLKKMKKVSKELAEWYSYYCEG
jgi:hypothetical protein